jgi:polyisoprenoid-binding protein YceI
MISTFSGVSREFGATVIITSNDSTSSKIDFWMNPYSVDTNEKKRNGHLKSQDYLDLRKFEKITFISDSFE